MEKIKKIWSKYKEIINYFIFGVLTTIVNYVAYIIFTKLMNIDYMISTVIAQIMAIIFAYITNKIFVFKSKGLNKKELIKEISSFLGFRILSLFMDLAFMYIFVDILHLKDTIMKLVSNVLIAASNYVFSKLFIFKKNK